jgi:hypothetical protein
MSEFLALQGVAPIIAAIVAATIAIVGWFAANTLASRREDRTKRLALTIEQTGKQIGEFYAPLQFLFAQLLIAVSVRDALMMKYPEIERKGFGKISYHELFLPIHKEIVNILKTRIHLLESTDLPADFNTYIEHFNAEQLAWRAADLDIAAWEIVQKHNFPTKLPDQLQRGRKAVEQRYEEAMSQLRGRAS